MSTSKPPQPPNSSTDEDEPNPIATQLIEQSLAPYRGLLSDEQLASFAQTLDLFLATHPDLAPALDRLRKRRPVAESATVDRSGIAVPEPQAGKVTGEKR